MIKLTDWLPFNNRSATSAKERLKIAILHQRAEDGSMDPEILKKLRLEITNVVNKYITTGTAEVDAQLQNNGNVSILELNVTLPNIAS